MMVRMEFSGSALIETARPVGSMMRSSIEAPPAIMLMCGRS
jgi:hypothetical protein